MNSLSPSPVRIGIPAESRNKQAITTLFESQGISTASLPWVRFNSLRAPQQLQLLLERKLQAIIIGSDQMEEYAPINTNTLESKSYIRAANFRAGIEDDGDEDDDILVEKKLGLGVGKSKFNLLYPNTFPTNITKPGFNSRVTVVTSYPKLVQKYLAGKPIDATIKGVDGQVEALVAEGFYWPNSIGADVVSTGKTAGAAWLRVGEQIFASELTLYTSSALTVMQRQMVDRFGQILQPAKTSL